MSDSQLLEAIGSIKPDLDALGIVVWVAGGRGARDQITSRGMIPADTENEPSDPIPTGPRHESASHEVALYIFTSGTTGELDGTYADVEAQF